MSHEDMADCASGGPVRREGAPRIAGRQPRGWRYILKCVGAIPNRLNIPDTRGHGASLRVTRHAKQRRVVLSHWRDGVCVASTPIDLAEVPALIGVLVEALGDAVTTSDLQSADRPSRPSPWSKIKNLFRPTLAKVVELPVIRGNRRERMTQR